MMAYIEAIVKIGNQKKVIDACEPQVCDPKPLSGWMVTRILYAKALLEDELNCD